MSDFRVIIAGSRYYDDYDTLKAKCDKILSAKLSDPSTTVIILSGGARGADTLGVQYAMERSLKVEWHSADWNRYGRAAGPRRNAEMAAVANALIAFPKDGAANTGTNNMISLAKERGLLVRVIEPKKKEPLIIQELDEKAFLATIKDFNGKVDGFSVDFGYLFQDDKLIAAFKQFTNKSPSTIDRTPGTNSKKWIIGDYTLRWKVDTD